MKITRHHRPKDRFQGLALHLTKLLGMPQKIPTSYPTTHNLPKQLAAAPIEGLSGRHNCNRKLRSPLNH